MRGVFLPGNRSPCFRKPPVLEFFPTQLRAETEVCTRHSAAVPNAGLGLTMVVLLSGTEACATEPWAYLAAVGGIDARAYETQILDVLSPRKQA